VIQRSGETIPERITRPVKSFTMRRPGMARITSHRAYAKRYIGLRLISVIFTVLGTLLLTLGCLLLAFCLYTPLASRVSQLPRAEVPFASRPIGGVAVPGSLGVALPAVWSFGLLIGGLQFLAMGTVCRVLINIEENTRISALCLEQLRSLEEPFGQNVGSLFRS
jgi:hypothetical protein